jgi:hypothetical protein
MGGRIHAEPPTAATRAAPADQPQRLRPRTVSSAGVSVGVLGCSPQEPRSRWKYRASAQRHSRVPTAIPAMATRAGRYPPATWTIGIAGQPPEIARPVPNSTAPGITPAWMRPRGAEDPQQRERARAHWCTHASMPSGDLGMEGVYGPCAERPAFTDVTISKPSARHP